MKPETDLDADDLAALIDELFANGSQHINLEIGKQTRVQTVSSTECNPKKGACAVPNFEQNDLEEEDLL